VTAGEAGSADPEDADAFPEVRQGRHQPTGSWARASPRLVVMTTTDHSDRQAVLTVLTTEHFALQGGRGSTVSESGTRCALYVGAVSSGLVALGFVGRGGEDRDTFNGFALVVLPTLYLLGMFTFVRLVQNSIEDIFLGRAINRIRQYYFSVIGDDAGYVMLAANDDPLGVLANAGMAHVSRWQLYFTLAMMVAVLNAVVGGSAVTLGLAVLDAPIGAAIATGVVAAAASIILYLRWQRAAHTAAAKRTDPQLPSVALGEATR
jgi:hypothetical protein